MHNIALGRGHWGKFRDNKSYVPQSILNTWICFEIKSLKRGRIKRYFDPFKNCKYESEQCKAARELESEYNFLKALNYRLD